MSNRPTSVLKARTHPIVRTLAAFPIVCFTCALLTDIVYVQTMQMMWADFSAWLLAVGMAGGVLAGVAAILNLLLTRNHGFVRPVWPIVIGSVLVLIVAFFDNLVHSRDAWTSVMPWGLALSGVTVLLMIVTAVLAFRTSGSHGETLPYEGLRS